LENVRIVASDDDAYKGLQKYFPVFIQAIIEAQKELSNALVPEVRAKVRKRTTSTLMNDISTFNLMSQLLGSEGVGIRNRNGQLQYLFSEGFFMKCKQSKRKRFSFINTQTMFEFMHQLKTMFPGMPPKVTNILLTFQFNKTRTQVEKIAILCPADERNYYWELPIPFEMTPDFAPLFPIPELPLGSKPRVVPKAKNTKKSKKGRVKKDGQQGTENKL